MPTQIKKKQLKTDEFIQPEATADWTRDDITASAKAIAVMIRNEGTKKITANYKIWELDEGIYLVDGTKQANYRGGTFTLYQNYYLFVMNQSDSVPETKKWIAAYETDNNGEDVHFIYGTCSSSNGYKAEKSLSEIRNMGGATANAAGSAGFAPTPAAGDNTKYLRGDATWQAIPSMTGATSSVAGSAGLVPAPSAGAGAKFLRGDGTWQENVKIYHITDEGLGVLNVDASVAEIISDYNNGKIVWLEADNYRRFPLYNIVNNPNHKEVRFGLSTFTNVFASIECYYYIGVSNNGVDTWGCATHSDGRFPGGNNFVGATSSVAGQNGLVPAPAAGDEEKVLFGDGMWKNLLPATIILSMNAGDYLPSGLYSYWLEYNNEIILISDIMSIIGDGRTIVCLDNNSIIWNVYHKYSNDVTFQCIKVSNNNMEIHRLTRNGTFTGGNLDGVDKWDDSIVFTTT